MPIKQDPRYAPSDPDSALGYLVEECGEVLAAVGKAQRWGLASFNPELVEPDQKETNRDWILRELPDLKRAIRYVEQFIGIGPAQDG